MTVLTAIFYGLLQGLTEFLPISSSGHLAILEHLLEWDSSAAEFFALEILLHAATLAAVFLVYYRDILALPTALFSLISRLWRRKGRIASLPDNERMVLYLIIATLPLLGAALLNDRLAWLYADVRIVGLLLMVNGCLLRMADRPRKEQSITLNRATPEDALTVGLAQMFAILPGLSRSGCTITAGLSRGWNRDFAVKFSFLLSIPAILGANLLQIPDLYANPLPADQRPALFTGMLAAFLAGIAAMKLLHWLSRRTDFRLFSWYCWLSGGLTLLTHFMM